MTTRVIALLVLWSSASVWSGAVFSQQRVFEFSYHVLAPQLPTGESNCRPRSVIGKLLPAEARVLPFPFY